MRTQVRKPPRDAKHTEGHEVTRRAPNHLGAVAATLAAITGYVVLALQNLRLPGLYYDEVLQIIPSLAMVRGPLEGSIGVPPAGSVFIGGNEVTFMTMDYIGAVKNVLYAPIGYLFGTGVTPVRLFAITLTVAVLIVTFLFVRELFGSSAIAAAGVALLAFDPGFIAFTRLDYGPTVIMTLLKVLAGWQFVRWWKTRSLVHLAIAAFALGLGVYDKVNFVWIAAGIVMAAAIVSPRHLLRRVTPKAVLVAVAGGLAGVFPLIVYNLSFPPPTLAAMRAGATGTNPPGGFLVQLRVRVERLIDLMDGQMVSSWIGAGKAWVSPVLPVLAGIAILLTLIGYARKKTRSRYVPHAYCVAAGAIIVLAATATVGGHAGHHLILVYPFFHLPLAAMAVEAGRLVGRRVKTSSRRAVAAAVTTAIVLVPSVAGVTSLASSYHWLGKTGGAGNFSDVIYPLTDWLVDENPGHTAYMLDWGIHLNFMALTEGEYRSIEEWKGLVRGGDPAEPLIESFEDPRAIYILHTAQATNFPLPRERFFFEVQAAGKRAAVQKTFTSRDGVPLIEAYRVIDE